MSNQSSHTFTSSSTVNYSSTSSSNIDGNVTGQSFSRSVVSDPSGTKVTTSTQNAGEPAVEETRHYDSQGRELSGGAGGRAIERVSDEEQARRDAEYEERIEDE